LIALTRGDLGARTLGTLRRRQERVNRSTDPRSTAVSSWKTFRGAARDEVVEKLKAMCSGIERCMYCEDSFGTAIEHFQPKADYPGYAFEWFNYLWACSHCNSNLKRDRFPLGDAGVPMLIDPTVVDPLDHLALSVTTGEYIPLDASGATSIEVFGLNREVCLRGRRAAWTCLIALVRDFDRSDAVRRHAILVTLTDFPFQGVRRWLVAIHLTGDRARVIPDEVGAILARYPELLI
jgi:uncharacterized protein (TIGR02646 family)